MIEISDNPELPIYKRLADAIGDAVLAGRLQPGGRLPSKVDLARNLGVSQTTVGHSYYLLQNRGIIRQKRGDGTYIELDAHARVRETAAPQFRSLVMVVGERDLTQCARDLREIVTDIATGLDDVLQGRVGRFVFVESFNRTCLEGLEEAVAVLFVRATEVDTAMLEEFKQRGVPMLEVWNYGADCAVPRVTYDPHKAAGVACRHLLECGYRRIGFIGDMGQEVPLGAKFFGFTNTLYRAQLDFSVRHVREVGHDFGAAFDAARDIVQQGDLPEAFFVDTDYKAMEVVCALKAAGLKVPDDVAVVGHDDTPEAARFDPPLTTVRIPRREIGQRAGNLLKDWASQGPPSIDETIPARLIVRGSTRPVGSARARSSMAGSSGSATDLPQK